MSLFKRFLKVFDKVVDTKSNEVDSIINYSKNKVFIKVNDQKVNEVDSIIDNFNTVEIGTQVWMKNNLDVDHYCNGDLIPQVADQIEWNNLTTGAWCYYNFDSENGTINDKLYNWHAINDQRGLAPIGWHIPSDAEWTDLSIYLGFDRVSSGLMKETGTTTNEVAAISKDFKVFPGGFLYYDGLFFNKWKYSDWWSEVENKESSTYRWFSYQGYERADMVRGYNNKIYGFSVRCLKD